MERRHLCPLTKQTKPRIWQHHKHLTEIIWFWQSLFPNHLAFETLLFLTVKFQLNTLFALPQMRLIFTNFENRPGSKLQALQFLSSSLKDKKKWHINSATILRFPETQYENMHMFCNIMQKEYEVLSWQGCISDLSSTENVSILKQ